MDWEWQIKRFGFITFTSNEEASTTMFDMDVKELHEHTIWLDFSHNVIDMKCEGIMVLVLEVVVKSQTDTHHVLSFNLPWSFSLWLCWTSSCEWEPK